MKCKVLNKTSYPAYKNTYKTAIFDQKMSVFSAKMSPNMYKTILEDKNVSNFLLEECLIHY